MYLIRFRQLCSSQLNTNKHFHIRADLIINKRNRCTVKIVPLFSLHYVIITFMKKLNNRTYYEVDLSKLKKF